MASEKKKEPLSETLKRAGSRALGGGASGAAAMAIQVLSLMPLRTAMNFQYAKGHSLSESVKLMYAEGKIGRFYRGLAPAMIQAPLARFGDTASNVGALALLDSFDSSKDLPVSVKTALASVTAGGFRILLVPVDTVKTMMQVVGKDGLATLKTKVRAGGPTVLFHGALASAGATIAGHYPWFFTYNQLNALWAVPEGKVEKLSRNAAIGFISSVVSDTVSNSIRVVKTYRQTSAETVSYPETVRRIVQADGIQGLLWRGLKTRLLANGLQGLLFSVLWRFFDEQIQKSRAAKVVPAAGSEATSSGSSTKAN